jgi:hypothetical protein
MRRLACGGGWRRGRGGEGRGGGGDTRTQRHFRTRRRKRAALQSSPRRIFRRLSATRCDAPERFPRIDSPRSSLRENLPSPSRPCAMIKGVDLKKKKKKKTSDGKQATSVQALDSPRVFLSRGDRLRREAASKRYPPDSGRRSDDE